MITENISIRKSLKFSSVPDSLLENNDLSHAARLVAAWALGRPDGWQFSVSHLKTVLRLSDNKWIKIRDELISAGYYIQSREQGENGKFFWVREFTDTPLFSPSPSKQGDGKSNKSLISNNKNRTPSPQKAIPGFTIHGEAIHGKRGDITIERKTIESKQQQQQPPKIRDWRTENNVVGVLKIFIDAMASRQGVNNPAGLLSWAIRKAELSPGSIIEADVQWALEEAKRRGLASTQAKVLSDEEWVALPENRGRTAGKSLQEVREMRRHCIQT